MTPGAREAAERREIRLVDHGGRIAQPRGRHLRVALGADHGGFALKRELLASVRELGHTALDLGARDENPVDYPDFARAVAEAVASGQCDFGICVDAAGIGSAIAANKVPGVRAAPCNDVALARSAREHNHANVLALGAKFVTRSVAHDIVRAFLGTAEGDERHARRVAKIEALERRYARRPDLQATDAGVGAVAHEALEAILTEVARQLLDHGIEPVSPWGSTTVQVELAIDRVRAVLDAGACRIGCSPCASPKLDGLASYLDHTLLKADATVAEIDKLCAEALQLRVASVCVNGAWVKRCAEILAGSGVLVCSVVGFPLGATASEVKAFEARRAIEDGACEIDMVQNVGALKSGFDDFVERDVALVVETCRRMGARSKVILETALLTEAEKVRACEIAVRAGADFVKTSTGFSRGGATVANVELMRRTVGPRVGVKAAGGIRDQAGAKALIDAGATRIGASASVTIVRGSVGRVEGY
ncbi:MAG: deoxyribose-phosphate aldolase [Planctomycetes bacterium]|nr:deoxyribose-phosphate aldolase [Planctomycetota bacterium]